MGAKSAAGIVVAGARPAPESPYVGLSDEYCADTHQSPHRQYVNTTSLPRLPLGRQVNAPVFPANLPVPIEYNTPYVGPVPRSVAATPPFNYSLFAGSLPDGLRVDPQFGRVQGTATELGSFTATLGVTDSFGTEIPLQMLAITVRRGSREQTQVGKGSECLSCSELTNPPNLKKEGKLL